jgi:hypothetical protein
VSLRCRPANVCSIFLASSPATRLESAAARLLLAHLGHAEALCELFSSLDCTRTRVEEVLVAQAMYVLEHALAQEPHVLRVYLPDVVDSLSAVLACRDHVFRQRVAVGGGAVGARRGAVGARLAHAPCSSPAQQACCFFSWHDCMLVSSSFWNFSEFI